MSETHTNKARDPVGDRYRPATIPEGEQDKLVRQYAEMAKEEQGEIVSLLSDALETVVQDLEDDPRENLIDVAWLPAPHLEAMTPLWQDLARSTEDEGWAGIVYLQGRRSLVIKVEVSYLGVHRELLPFFLAQSMQDAVIEEVREARPACPVHGHPLNPAATPSGSWWQCPEGPDVWSCAMGSYHRASG